MLLKKIYKSIAGFPSIENLLSTYGMISFQFDIHPMLLTIEVDMQEKHRIGNAVSNGIFSLLRHEFSIDLIFFYFFVFNNLFNSYLSNVHQYNDYCSISIWK